jgi:hypothetical protein
MWPEGPGQSKRCADAGRLAGKRARGDGSDGDLCGSEPAARKHKREVQRPLAMILRLPSALLTAIMSRLHQDNLFAVALVCRELRAATAEAAALLGCDGGQRLTRGITALLGPPCESFEAFLARRTRTEGAVTVAPRDDSTRTGREAEDARRHLLLKRSLEQKQGKQPFARPARTRLCLTTQAAYLLDSRMLSFVQWGVACRAPLTRRLFARAAISSSLDMLRYLRAIGCPWDETVCSTAAYNGRLDVLQWAREEGCPWDAHVCKGTEGGLHGSLRLGACKWLPV